MSTSETDSEPELATDTVSSLTAYAHLSAQPSQESAGHETVAWAVHTLATLDFRLVREDTALHSLIQKCACTILALLSAVLQRELADVNPCNFIPDIASLLKPSFQRLLFQYRRLFRVIAARNLKSDSAPLAIVCWVDVVLAKLGDVVVFVAAGLDADRTDQLLPEFLKARKNEDNLRAAMQLPDNWDVLSSMLLSERVSAAAKRLSTRLTLGTYILCPALSGQVGVDGTICNLLSTFAEFVRLRAARLHGLRSVSGPSTQYLLQQERLTDAMAVSLFAAADMAKDSIPDAECGTTFRPQTMAAAMQLLRFILNEGGNDTRVNSFLNPSDCFDVPTSVIARWGIVPQWTWNVWLEYRSLYADTIACLTSAYIQHHSTGTGTLLEISDLVFIKSRSTDEAAMIGVMIDLVFRFISVLSADRHSNQSSANMMSVLEGICRLMTRWMDQNSCEIQNSKECCKALIALFACSSQSGLCSALNDLVIECLALVKEQCAREAWKAVLEDNDFRFQKILGQSLLQTRMALSSDDLPESSGIYAAQLMQFIAVMVSKGARPLDLDGSIEFIEAFGERVVEMGVHDGGFLFETLLTCLATANLYGESSNKVTEAGDEESIWRLWMCVEKANLLLVSAFSLYVSSAPVTVDPVTYLEGFEHLLDVALLICSGEYPHEDERTAMIVLPTICDALAHLLAGDDAIGAYTRASARMSALDRALRCRGTGGEDGGLGTALRDRARGAWARKNEGGGARSLVFCRPDGHPRLVYVPV